MDENAIGIIMSNADTKHQISFESGALGMKPADMTYTHVTYLHTENTQKKKLGTGFFSNTK
jgi:hypothetical protein